MANSNISTVASKLSPHQIYGDAGLIYIRYKAHIVTKSIGRKRSAALYPDSALSWTRKPMHLILANTSLS